MLEELLKHDRFGNRDELLFFLFDGLSTGENQSLLNVRKYCISNVFSIARCFDGILKFLQFISFIDILNDNISLNKSYFEQSRFDKFTYLDNFHLYEHLILALKKAGVLKELFNENNIKFNPKLSQYYILENKLSYKYFQFRNMLLSTGFFHRNEKLPNHLLIKREFTTHFMETIVNDLAEKSSILKKISLSHLKKMLHDKEESGKSAELFALKYEYNRLIGHPDIEKVGIISEEYVNAGYDIETFEDIDSILIDKFIEVKSYQGEISFYWSKNEIDRAKELKSKYYLYLIDRLKITEKDYKPQQLQDPYKKIFENDLWKKETESWKITLDDLS